MDTDKKNIMSSKIIEGLQVKIEQYNKQLKDVRDNAKYVAVVSEDNRAIVTMQVDSEDPVVLKMSNQAIHHLCQYIRLNQRICLNELATLLANNNGQSVDSGGGA